MSLQHARRMFQASRQGFTYFGFFTIAVIWVLIGVNLQNQRDSAIEAADKINSGLVQIFEENIARTLHDVDKNIQVIRRTYEAHANNKDLFELATSPALKSTYVIQLSMADENGIVFFSDVGGVQGRVDISDREHFKIPRGMARDDLFISKPILGRVSGLWSVQLVRRLRKPDGSFGGIVVASVDPYAISKFYNSVDFLESGSFTLLGEDRVVRARGSRTGTGGIGEVSKSNAIFEAAATADSGTLRFPGNFDPGIRMGSFRRVKGFPLIVNVSVDQAEVLRPYYRARVAYFSAGGFLSFVIVLAMGFAIRQRMRHDAMNRALSDSQSDMQARRTELTATLEHMNQGIMMVDKDGVIAVLNHRTCQLLDVPAAFMSARTRFEDLLRYQFQVTEFGDDDSKIAPELRRALDLAANLREENVYERVRPNGTVLEVRSKPLAEGGFVRTFTDITEMKRHESALKSALEDLERFAHLASHDLQEPLRKIGTYVGILNIAIEENDREQIERASRVLNESSKRGRNIVSDLLRYSKLRNRPLERALVSVDEMLSEVVAQISDPTTKDHFEIEHHLPPIKVNCDGSLILQVLQNLIGNGIKYRKPDQKAFIVVYGSHDDTAERYFLHTADNGIGFDMSFKDRIFEPFRRLVSKDQYSGTGIGLSLVRSIVEKHGWTVSATSEVGVGSTFTIAIPLEDIVEAGPALHSKSYDLQETELFAAA